jgi:hypothetical protein
MDILVFYLIFDIVFSLENQHIHKLKKKITKMLNNNTNINGPLTILENNNIGNDVKASITCDYKSIKQMIKIIINIYIFILH